MSTAAAASSESPEANEAQGASSTEEGHPGGLYTLFGAEAWERLSYYGMRALLVLYMVKHLKYARADALEVYGIYTGAVYLTPILGGYLADKILGRRKAVLIGGIVMAIGHLLMAFEPYLYLALGTLIVGNGFFKPNISSMVGGLYRDGDPRRDGGFTIFYAGINLGAYYAPRICGSLGENVGWHWGFSAAAVGMTFGLLQFVIGQKRLFNVGLPPKAPAGSESLTMRDYGDVALWVVGCCLLVVGALQGWKFIGPAYDAIPSIVKTVVYVAIAVAVISQLFRGANKEEAQGLGVFLLLCFFNIFFWMGFEQAGGTMTLFADEQTDRTLSGGSELFCGLIMFLGVYNIWRDTRGQKSGIWVWRGLMIAFVVEAVFAHFLPAIRMTVAHTTQEVKASQFQAINPFVIVALAPTFARMWTRLDSGRLKTTAPTKMAIGMIILGLGFVVLYMGQKLAGTGKVSPLWLFAVYVVHTVGELCLSPIGLSMVTKLAPKRVVSLAMGMWFFSNAVANYLAAKLESILEKSHMPIYLFLILSSIGPALVLMALAPVMKKWTHGRA